MNGAWSFLTLPCTVTLVDRLAHRSEIIEIEGDSYQLKEAKERSVSPSRPSAAASGFP